MVFRNSEPRSSTDLQGGRGGYGYTAKIPLKDIKPGRYVLTVIAKSRVGSNPAVQRQVRITVEPPRQAE